MAGPLKSDTYYVTQRTDNLGNLLYGPNIWSIVNQRTGEEVARVEGKTAATLALPVIVADLNKRLAL